MEKFRVEHGPEGPKCDFCSGVEVFATYGAENFVHDKIEGWEIASEGPWTACRECAELIDRERWKDLLDRAEATFSQKWGYVPGLRKRIATIHQQFREHRRRPA